MKRCNLVIGRVQSRKPRDRPGDPPFPASQSLIFELKPWRQKSRKGQNSFGERYSLLSIVLDMLDLPLELLIKLPRVQAFFNMKKEHFIAQDGLEYISNGFLKAISSEFQIGQFCNNSTNSRLDFTILPNCTDQTNHSD